MSRFDDSKKRELVERFKELNKTKNISESLREIGVARASLERWAQAFDIDLNLRSASPERIPAVATAVLDQEPTRNRRGLAMVLMGDSDEIRSLLPSAYNILRGER